MGVVETRAEEFGSPAGIAGTSAHTIALVIQIKIKNEMRPSKKLSLPWENQTEFFTKLFGRLAHLGEDKLLFLLGIAHGGLSGLSS